MTLRLSLAILLLASLPLSAVGQDESAPTAWEMFPYRIHVLTAVEADASLPPRLEQELSADLASRASAAVGGAWRLEVSRAPPELRHRILHALADVTSEDLPSAAKKGDKV